MLHANPWEETDDDRVESQPNINRASCQVVDLKGNAEMDASALAKAASVPVAQRVPSALGRRPPPPTNDIEVRTGNWVVPAPETPESTVLSLGSDAYVIRFWLPRRVFL